MKHRKERKSHTATVAAIATGGLIAAGLAMWPATADTPQPEVGLGKVLTCQVDGNSGCTIQHGLGVKPDSVVVTVGGRSQMVSVPADKISATSFRVNFNWRTGATFPAGTSFTFQVHYDYVPAPPATTPPPDTTPPPATTPPPVTTPPPATTPAPSPSPSPTDTASPAVKVCNSSTPGWFTDTATSNSGGGTDYPPYYVHNNMWNNSNGTYTLNACAADNWYELATQPKPGDNGVQTYPNVHKDYADPGVALYAADGKTPKIRSSKFAAKTPDVCTGCVYDVAYDVWLGSGLNNELMIWTENKGQTPAGNKVGQVTFAGHTYDVWHDAPDYTAYVSTVTQKYGTMPLSSFFDDMKARGWLPSATTWQVDFGVEIVSTANVKQRFDFTDFSIDDDY